MPSPQTTDSHRIDVSTRIRRAIHLNDLTLLKRIIKNNPKDLQNPDFTNNGNTSLHIAAQLGRLDIVEFLITAGHEDHGISLNINRDTPLLIAVQNSPMCATTLATHFPRCIPWKNRQGADALMLTARTPHTPLLDLLLTLAPPPGPFSSALPTNSNRSSSFDPTSPLHAIDSAGNTPLHYASAYGQLKSIRTLLEHGADAGARNAWSWTPQAYSASVQAEVYFKDLRAAQERERGVVVGSGVGAEREGNRSRGGSGGRSGSGGVERERDRDRETEVGRNRGGSGGKGGVRLVGKEEEWAGFEAPPAVRAAYEGRVRSGGSDGSMMGRRRGESGGSGKVKAGSGEKVEAGTYS
ncbi:hypothetical protein MMC21_001842 [Puttea exsequens]|nr:hypothetical protein [Puttea exsequens]